MILTCPVCSARYLIAGDAIGEQGRDVRCGKCGHSWTQEPVHDSLDELSKGNKPEPDVLTKSSLDEAVESFLNDEIPESVKPLPEQAAPISPKKTKSAPAKKAPKEPGVISQNKRLITGAVGALAIFAVLAGILIAFRAPVMGIMPFTKPVFVALGLEEKGDARTLVFDSVTAKIEGNTLTVAGSLINLSSSTMALPPMVVDILDQSGAVLKTLPAEVAEKTLNGEQSINLNMSFSDIPKAGEQARLRFSGQDDETSEENVSEEKPATTDEEGADNTHAQPEASSDHSTAHE